MDTRRWLPAAAGGADGAADKVFFIGFEYKNGAAFKARALRQKLVNYLPEGTEGRRWMDVDGRRPNDDIDLDWPVVAP